MALVNPKNSPFAKLADNIEGLYEHVMDELVRSMKAKTFVDTGELRDSIEAHHETGEIVAKGSETNGIEKIASNEYGNATMTGSSFVRRSVAEVPEYIRDKTAER